MKKIMLAIFICLFTLSNVACNSAKDNGEEKASETVSEETPKTLAVADYSDAKKEMSENTPEKAAAPHGGPAPHTLWDAILKKNVKDGKVNYKAILADPNFEKYLGVLKSHVPGSHWSSNDKMAYWINVYNAFTVKVILDHYPVKSITDIKFGDKSAWDHEWIKIGGTTYSLNHVENEILRKDFDDPRIHFGIVCASFSCPQLRSEAFVAGKLDAQLDEQATKFMNDTRRNQISADNPKVSQIFDWFKGDFTKKGTVIDYVNKYSKVKINADATIGYMEYDWSLNE